MKMPVKREYIKNVSLAALAGIRLKLQTD